MPSAVANLEETKRLDLKSLAEGFVLLRRMTYGQVVQRRTMSRMTLSTQGNRKSSLVGEMAMASKEITLFEFAHCIVDHNLEDVDGRKLNLSLPTDFDRLDPRVGQEIEEAIGDMNNFEDEGGEQEN